MKQEHEKVNVLGYHIDVPTGARHEAAQHDEDILMVSDSIKDRIADHDDLVKLQIEEQTQKRYMVIVEPKGSALFSGVLLSMHYDFEKQETQLGVKIMTPDAFTFFINANIHRESLTLASVHVMQGDEDVLLMPEKKLHAFSVQSIDHESEMCEILMSFRDSYA